MEENVLAGAAIIGLINTVQIQFPQVRGLYGVGLALLLGVVAGYLGLFGLTVESGVVTALASSGVFKLAGKIGGQ